MPPVLKQPEKMLRIYFDDNLCLFFSPNRVAQLKLVPEIYRPAVIEELARRFLYVGDAAPPKTTVWSDLVMWDILRENGWVVNVRP